MQGVSLYTIVCATAITGCAHTFNQQSFVIHRCAQPRVTTKPATRVEARIEARRARERPLPKLDQARDIGPGAFVFCRDWQRIYSCLLFKML